MRHKRLLKLEVQDESLLAGYTEDVAALIAAKNVEQVTLIMLGLDMAKVNE
ncbi:hypothetical protein J6590_085292 [Homalodisca vitripennis]|nr:hypothetical protein J6590_085292 [Homalodisca vitripennis]